jgi:hypothetical protein
MADAQEYANTVATWLKRRTEPSSSRALGGFLALAAANVFIVALGAGAGGLVEPQDVSNLLFIVNILALLLAGFMGIARLAWRWFGPDVTIRSQIIELAAGFVWLLFVFAAIALAT